MQCLGTAAHMPSVTCKLTVSNLCDLQAKYNEAIEETTWEKLKRLATGRSRSQAYLDGAKERAHNAGGHLSDVSAVQVCTISFHPDGHGSCLLFSRTDAVQTMIMFLTG